MELTKDESKRILRRIELEAYSALVTALRAQGELDRGKKKLLRELGAQLSISTERHRAEIRRAISDDRLSMIAECVCGSDAAVEWECEGRRVVPLMPRLVPQTAFTGTATAAANQAASVNATLSSSSNNASKLREEDDMKARKRQRTTSPRPVQKVIVSSSCKTTTARETFSTVPSSSLVPSFAKDVTARYPSVQTKQETNSATPLSSISMKIGQLPSVTSGQQLPTKPIVLGGSKPASSVSMATNTGRHFATLPASCLQAHASVLSGSKTRPKINLVKQQKPKPKFKPVVPMVKLRPPGAVPTTVTHSTVALGDRNKAKDASTAVVKSLQVPRSSPTITLSPKSSLTTLKNTVQQKSQSPPTVVRPVTSDTSLTPSTAGTARQSLLSKMTARRSLPIILPKSLPPKPNIPRRLTSILPAPTKTTPSVTKKVIRPACTTALPPIPIAPLPRPPSQSFPALSATVKPPAGKLPAVSLTGGPIGAGNREGDVSSPDMIVATGNSPSRKSSDVSLERECLSPVSEILTLVTSPSSVPFVTSSPVKSSTTTSRDEISLKCDEKLPELKDLLKDDDFQPTSSVHASIPAITTINLRQINDEKDDMKTSTCSVTQEILKTHIVNEGNSLSGQITRSISDQDINQENGGIDISLLVNELTDCIEQTFVDKGECCTNIPWYSPDHPDFKDIGPHAVENTVSSDVTKVGISSTELPVNQTEIANARASSSVKDIAGSDEAIQLQDRTASEKELLITTSAVKLTTEDLETNSKVEKDVVQQVSELSARDDKSSKVEEIVDSGSNQVKGNKSFSTKNQNNKDNASSSKSRTSDDTILSSSDDSAGRKCSSSGRAEVDSGSVECQFTKDGVVQLKEEEGGSVKSKTVAMRERQSNTEQHLEKENEDVDVMDTTMTTLQDVVGPDRVHTTQKATQSDSMRKTREESCETSPSHIDIVEGETVREAGNLTESSRNAEGQEADCVTRNKAEISLNKETCFEVAEDRKDVTSKPENESASLLCSPSSSENVSQSSEEQGEDDGKQQSSEGDYSDSSEMTNVRMSGRKRKAPPPRDLAHATHPPGWIRGALLLLQRVSRFRGNSRSKGEPCASSWFMKPVEPADAPGYHKIIKTPMDFGTIKTKLEAAEYKDLAQFNYDMSLVKLNCYKYNPPGHDVRRDCDEVFQFYETEYQKYAEKLEKCHLVTSKKPKVLFGGNEQK